MGLFDIIRGKKDVKIKNKDIEVEGPAQCPYCGVQLPKKPQRKTKCKSCGKYMFVRKHPKTNKRKIMTEDKVKETEYLWKVMELGFSLDDHSGDYTEMKAGLSKKFGRAAHASDVIWGLYNNLILQTKDLHNLKMIYYEMALFLDSEGKNPHTMLQQASKMELINYKNQGVKKVEILATANSCPSCQQFNGKIYATDKALKEMPIPNEDCTTKMNGEHGFCRCCYVPAIDLL